MSNRRLQIVPEDQEDFHERIVTLETKARKASRTNLLRDILLALIVVWASVHTYIIITRVA